MVDLAHVSDDELWDLLMADAASAAEEGHSVDLARYLDGVPDIRSRASAIQAAIAAVFENGVTRGIGREATADALTDRYPEFVEQVQEVLLVGELLGDVTDDEPALHSPARSLPCQYGLDWQDGQPRYMLYERLASGTRGAVYRGVDRALSSTDRPAPVAVKIVPSWSGMDFHEVLAEAVRAKQVDHPSVARVLDVGEAAGDECFIVFEFIDGRTLASVIDDLPAPLGARELVSMLLPIVEGLATAHDIGLAHLDLHPRNVLIDRSGNATLIDFGLGVAAYEAWRPAERPLGSLGFMAPEIFSRDVNASPMRADAYGLAGLIFWCLTGVIPNGQSVEEIEARLLDRSASLPGADARRFRGDVDEDLSAILARGLSRNPETRYANAAALADDLRSWLGFRSIAWKRTMPWQRLRLYARRSPGTLIASVAAIATAILGVGAGAYQFAAHEAEARVAEAEHRAAQAEAERQLLAAEAELATGIRDMTNIMAGFLRSRAPEAAGRPWVVMLTLAHNLIEKGLRLDAEVLAATIDDRIEFSRYFLASSEESAGPDSLEAVLWRSALGSWLLDAGEYDEACDHLRVALEGWKTRCEPGDPVLDRLAFTLNVAEAFASEGSEAARRASAELVMNSEYFETLRPGMADDISSLAGRQRARSAP